MEFCFSGEIIDRAVPNDAEMMDQLGEGGGFPLEDWQLWEFSNAHGFEFLNNYPSKARKQTTQQFNCKRQSQHFQSSGVPSVCDREAACSPSPFSGYSISGYTAGKSTWSQRISSDQPDYQFQKLCQNSTDQVDDNLLHNLPAMRNPYQPVGFFTEPECSSGSVENFLSDMIVDSQRSCMSDSLSSEMNGFPFSTAGVLDNLAEKEYMSNSARIGGSTNLKAPKVTLIGPHKLTTFDEVDPDVCEEKSIAATALRELEVVMTQLNEETRTCFRDALYRLAKRTSHRWGVNERSAKSMTDNPRFDRHYMEAETTAIDRTVANLLFNKLVFTPRDLSYLSAIQLTKESLTASESHISNSIQPLTAPSYLLPASSPLDIEFPFSLENNIRGNKLLIGFPEKEPSNLREYHLDISSWQRSP